MMSQDTYHVFTYLRSKKPLNYTGLSKNPALTWRMIDDHPTDPWNWFYLSGNPAVSMDIVERTASRYKWSFRGLSSNPNLTVDFITRNRDRLADFEWFHVSQHAAVTWEDVRRHPDFFWSAQGLSINPNVTWETVCAHETDIEWSYSYLSLNPNITPDIVLAHIDAPWDIGHLCMNPNFDVDALLQLESLFGVPLCWKRISANPSTTVEKVYSPKHIGCPWDWRELSKNSNMMWEHVYISSYLFRDVSSFSLNPNITLDIVEANPQIPWDWTRLSENPGIFVKNKESADMGSCMKN